MTTIQNRTPKRSLGKVRMPLLALLLLLAGLPVHADVVITGTVLGGSGIDLYVPGDWTNNGAFTANESTVHFTGSAAQAIGGTSTTTFDGLTINNSSTGVTLNTAATVSNTLTLTDGNLTTTSTNLLTLGAGASIGTPSADSFVNGPMAVTGTGDKMFPIGKGTAYRPVALGDVAGTVPVIKFEVFNSNPGGTPQDPPPLVKISTVRYWKGDIISGPITGATVNLTYGSDDGVQDIVNLRVVRASSVDGTYDNYGGTGSAAPSGNITSTDVGASLDFFTLGSTTHDNSLPVVLSSFTAAVIDGFVELKWRTESEVHNLGFDLYRSESGDGPYVKVNGLRIEGAGSTTTFHEYAYVDRFVREGRRYFYYLEDIDFSSVRTKSSIVEVLVARRLPEQFALLQNAPNPFNPVTEIRYQLSEASVAVIAIYDALGREVRVLVDGFVEAGYRSMVWDGRDEAGELVASGVYVIRMEAGDFLAVRKLTLIR